MTFHVAIPDTSLVDCQDLRQKTVKIGQLARAFVVFRVERVIIYESEHPSRKYLRDSDLLLKLLKYLDTPQYLRRRVYSRSPALKYAGVLPPLRTRSHPLDGKESHLIEGDTRWGIQVRSGKIDIGLESLVDYSGVLSEREPTLFRIVKTHPKIRMEVIQRDDIKQYFGFEVERTKSLVDSLRKAASMTRIAFSRDAVPFIRAEDDIKSTVSGTKSVFAVFGGPRYGVRDLLNREKDELREQVDFWVNSIPDQGTATVRLEEALLASLSLLNVSIGSTITKPGYHSPT
ncbi:MAG: putative RNA uridine N3 methyltransferase [Candidatus Thorarchaeota archaeon]|jgi:predicted SPOUT superfamily RNA methylase MTH1